MAVGVTALKRLLLGQHPGVLYMVHVIVCAKYVHSSFELDFFSRYANTVLVFVFVALRLLTSPFKTRLLTILAITVASVATSNTESVCSRPGEPHRIHSMTSLLRYLAYRSKTYLPPYRQSEETAQHDNDWLNQYLKLANGKGK